MLGCYLPGQQERGEPEERWEDPFVYHPAASSPSEGPGHRAAGTPSVIMVTLVTYALSVQNQANSLALSFGIRRTWLSILLCHLAMRPGASHLMP